jgi:hypothetical protein
MGIDSVEIADDRRSVDITVSFTNHSDQALRIHVLETGVRLAGSSVSGGSERYDDLVLDPGAETTLTVTSQVNRLEAQYVDDRLQEPAGLRWNITGRVRVSVEDLSEDLWLPFRSNVDVQP